MTFLASVLAPRRTSSAPYYQQVATDGAIALWKMGTSYGSGGANDSIGGHHLAQASGSSTPTVVSPINTANVGAWNIDGAANFQSSSVTDLYRSVFSLEFWGQWTTSGNLVLAEINGNNGFSVQLIMGQAAGRYGLKMNVGGSQSDIYTGDSTNLNNGVRHHVLFVINGSISKIYVDGVDKTAGNMISTPTYAAQPLMIGSRNGSLGVPGIFSDFAYYPSALSAAQALSHYNAGK